MPNPLSALKDERLNLDAPKPKAPGIEHAEAMGAGEEAKEAFGLKPPKFTVFMHAPPSMHGGGKK